MKILIASAILLTLSLLGRFIYDFFKNPKNPDMTSVLASMICWPLTSIALDSQKFQLIGCILVIGIAGWVWYDLLT